MSKQRRTIMGACDYSIATMQQLRKDLMDFSAPNPELNWAIGGIVCILTSKLLAICNDVLQESAADGLPNADQYLSEIKLIFNDFVEGMINHE